MNRRKLREEIFKIVFGIEFHTAADFMEQVDTAIGQIRREREQAGGVLEEEDADYILQKAAAIAEKCEEIDRSINEAAKSWKTSRMGKADLAIIRLAVYEMRYDEEIDVPVAINEAVELAKKYGGEESPRFVNGILAKLVQPEKTEKAQEQPKKTDADKAQEQSKKEAPDKAQQPKKTDANTAQDTSE